MVANYTLIQARLIAPNYALGDQKLFYSDIPKWQECAAQFSMILEPSLWGWGNFYKSTLSIAELAVKTAKKTLAEVATEITNKHIDTVLICSSHFRESPEEHYQLLQDIILPLKLEHAEVIGLTLGRCTNLIKSLRIAQARIVSGQSQKILVITADRIFNEEDRLENFALFSDGAASCLVVNSCELPFGFNIVASAEKQDLQLSSQGLSVELAKDVNQKLLNDAHITLSDIERLFHTNVYFPLCHLKELQAGYISSQLYTDNIMRIGHCFAADPLINLIDAQQKVEFLVGDFIQLAASIPGARASLLLQKGS